VPERLRRRSRRPSSRLPTSGVSLKPPRLLVRDYLAVPQHFGPSIGIAVVDNLFGVMQGAKAIVLAQQKLWWMSAAAKYR
jgi:hypothetical protein